MTTLEIAIRNQMLTSSLLSDKPLLYTKGQSVFHNDLGLCEVVLALGARKRQIRYRYFDAQQQPETKTMWVDVADLTNADQSFHRDLVDLARDEAPMIDPSVRAQTGAFPADNQQN